jgi:hypothetical protein
MFRLAHVPLTNMLNKQEAGYEVTGKNKVQHLFYIDDLKLFSWDEPQLQQELTTVKSSGYDIQMEFTLNKCATAVFKHGKLTKRQNISLNNQTRKKEKAWQDLQVQKVKAQDKLAKNITTGSGKFSRHS